MIPVVCKETGVCESPYFVVHSSRRVGRTIFYNLSDAERWASFKTFSDRSKSCADCHAGNLQVYLTSQRDGRTLCEACFAKRKEARQAKEISREEVVRRSQAVHPLVKLDQELRALGAAS